MNGTEDRWMPWDGGDVRGLGKSTYGAVVSTPKTYSFWSRRLGCGRSSGKVKLPDRAADDGVTAEKKMCRAANGGEVVVYILKGGGHTVPAVKDAPGPIARNLSERTFGKESRDFDAAEVVWTFLRSHARH